MTVFVDTSAIVALIWARDANHAEAVDTWKGMLAGGFRLCTTDLVLAETVVVARSRAGYDLSVRAGERLLVPPFELVWADRPLFDEAWTLYRRYREHTLSLCDCVSFALMRRRRMKLAFAFDDDFERVGFIRARP